MARAPQIPPPKRRKVSHPYSSLAPASSARAPSPPPLSHSHGRQASPPGTLTVFTPPSSPEPVSGSDEESDEDDDYELVTLPASPRPHWASILKPTGTAALPHRGKVLPEDGEGSDNEGENKENDDEPVHYSSSDDEDSDDEEVSGLASRGRHQTAGKKLPERYARKALAEKRPRFAGKRLRAQHIEDDDDDEYFDGEELHEYAYLDDDDDERIAARSGNGRGLLRASGSSDAAESPRTAHARFGRFLEDTLLKIKAREGIAALIRAEQQKMRPNE